MNNFDLRKYLAEGKLLKEAFYPEFEGETNDKINDIAIAVVDELESKLDSESSGILKGMDYYVGSDGMDNDEVEQGFTKWFIDLVKYLSKNNNEVTISSVEQDGKVFTPAITLKYLDNGKEDISWKLERDLAEGKLFEEDFKNPILDKYLELKKSIDYKTVFPTDLQSFLDSLDNTEREGLERDLAEGKLLKEDDNGIKFINKFNPSQKIIDMYNENPHLKKPLSSLSKYKKIQAIDALKTHLSGGQAKNDMVKEEDWFNSSLAGIIEAWADDYYKDSDFFSYGMYVDKDYFNFFNLNKDLLLKKYKKQFTRVPFVPSYKDGAKIK